MQENRPIIALDFASKAQIEQFLAKFPADESLFVKIGMELFYQEGPTIVQFLKEQGHDIFLDLKLHDIPNTVEKAMKGIAKLGVKLTNVHAAGGIQMMQAALKGLTEGSNGKVPMLIAVTQLTSTSQEQMNQEQKIPGDLLASVINYAKCSQQAGLAGVVCSALEASAIHQATSDDFVCLTPGIRPSGSQVGDQKRVVTPALAKAYGANFIVVGRPITQAVNPYEAYQAIKKEWNGEE
ncbi:orotidine-5'-phosphate decarboxylase [Enterococcus cecorum]|uniref:orotidine-5'-phosphate decarboxylase n=1 Tax=Enterococcus cecorum TaxID=44008 RepID=UPI000B2BAB38|nr:orotidine-5'-phosphate decarboxylase [Enterococcus cecorum]HLQ87039.1 orotidine-5'-phosphate decarboxylase [Enterococcus sp.]MCJ0552505.1 orotidine-5'-phosphate decarboxylase [Enterococcus cecorum]MCJ0557949.1 orotidine-5'-phosphate decarboxylase [Enterococcus cecorum]MCJ0562017.1 orotidine-5'-phosphate decarboxylase [Enterococcus cecorum]MCJ0564280.1 orotidine-5'-phosphate decarboxylase [Enterococcus cecorum]